MRKLGIFDLSLYFHFSHIGLVRLLVCCEVNKAHLAEVEAAAEALNYWTYITRAHGRYEGIFAIYAFPHKQAERVNSFYGHLIEAGLIEKFELFCTGDPVPAVPDFASFDFESLSWRSLWNSWLTQIQTSSEVSLKGLSDPLTYEGEFDVLDLRLIEQFEMSGIQKFAVLGKTLGLSAQGVRYHYENHLIRRGIVVGYLPRFLPLPLEMADLYVFAVHFTDANKMAHYVSSLKGKYFIRNYSKILGRNSLTITMQLGRTELTSVFDCLYALSREGWVENFSYVMLDISKFKDFSIRPQNYADGNWIYKREDAPPSIRPLTGTTQE
jgi:hypothetical protein